MRLKQFLCLVLISLVAGVASARPKRPKDQPADVSQKNTAADHYKKGVSLYKEGDYASALAEFRAAYQALPSFEVLYNIGLTERRLFKYGQAVRTLNRYLEEGARKVPPDRRESVETELSQIRTLTSKVTINVEGASATVFVDGEEVGKSPLAEPVLLGPGKHTFRATRDGEPDAEQVIELASGSTKEVKLELKPKAPQGPVEIGIETEPAEAVLMVDGKLAGVSPVKVSLTPGSHEVIAELDGYQSARTDIVVEPGRARTVKLKLVPASAGGGRGRFPVLGVVLFGVGVVSAGLAVLFAVQSGGAARQVSDFYRLGGPWDSMRQGVEAGGVRDQTLAAVFIGTAAAAVAGGVVATILTVTKRDDAADNEGEEARWFLTPIQDGAVVTWSTRF